MERKNDGKLAVRKRVHDYATIRGVPTDALILQNILPSSRRIVTLTGFSFDPSRRPDNLIEWFEYCRGGDLMHAVLQSSALSEDFIWHCFIQIAEALDVLHNAGSQRVVHRDLKPENIFLEQKYRHQPPWPNLKLGDFGCATLKEHTEGLVVPLWQGPELPFLCAAGDFWALGAIVHWLAHGWPPIAPRPADFRGSQVKWEEQPRARKPIRLPTSCSSKLNDCMMKCLAFDPRDRISSHKLLERLRRDRPRVR